MKRRPRPLTSAPAVPAASAPPAAPAAPALPAASALPAAPALPSLPALIVALVRVPCCLALLAASVLATATGASAAVAPVAPHARAAARTVAPPPGADGRGGAVLAGQVTPVSAQVGQAQNGDFTIGVTNTGTAVAQDVRVLLDEATLSNPVGSADGRCLGRLDQDSPADLWCELGDVAPRQTVTVEVHAFMNECVWQDPYSGSLRAPAFHWRVAYTDGSSVLTENGPTPRWSCATQDGGADTRPGTEPGPEQGTRPGTAAGTGTSTGPGTSTGSPSGGQQTAPTAAGSAVQHPPAL